MKNRIEKADVEFLCHVTKSLAFVAQRINRQLSKGGKPKAGTAALDGFRKIDLQRLLKLKRELPYMHVKSLVDCYNEVKVSESEGWKTYVFKWAWKPESYDINDPTRSMSVEQWGIIPGKNDYGASWPDGCAVPLSLRLSQHGQVRTLLDIAKTLNESYHFRSASDFHQVFFETVHKGIQRGTFAKTALAVLVRVLSQNQDSLFCDGRLDFNKYAEAVERDIEDVEESPIAHLYVQRVKTMFLRIAALLNDMMHYNDADSFLADLNKVVNLDVGFNPFKSFGLICRIPGWISNNWKRLCRKDGVLDSSKLERYFHSQHYDSVSRYGLDSVLERDFKASAPNVFDPKKPFTAPTYVEDRFFEDHCTSGKKYRVKSCGSCGDVFAHELFEFEMIMPIVEREIASGVYVRRGKYILPVVDDSLPIFCEGHGRVNFDMMVDQIRFMYDFHETGRLPDVDIR